MPSQDADPIKHVVLLMLENHSFDQMMGCFKEVYPQMEGVDPAHPRCNKDADGNIFLQNVTRQRQMLLDPQHEHEDVVRQLADNNGGFVRDFVRSSPDSTPEERAFIMSYYPLDFLPALHGLGRAFALCDHWFAAVPGPTWPNRFFALSGTSCGRVVMPDAKKDTADVVGWFAQKQTTLFDRLTERNIDWKIYFHDIPQSAVLCSQRQPVNAARYFYMPQFFADARGREDEFPQFCLIEPDYKGADENDDHPPHDVMKAQRLLADVYNALRANPDLWNSTLFIMVYDEHGGFYDHMQPPAIVPPDDRRDQWTFDRLGVRVPAILISPWVEAALVQEQFEHTSILRYLIEKWKLGSLGARAQVAASIASVITRQTPRTDTPLRIELTRDQLCPPDPEVEERANAMVTGHHKSLSQLIAFMAGEALDSAPRIYSSASRMIEAVESRLGAALHTLIPHHTDVHVPIVEPDKIIGSEAFFLDDFGHYLKHLKLRALKDLADRIRNQEMPLPMRLHAARSLALITNHHMGMHDNPIVAADQWLKRHGVK